MSKRENAISAKRKPRRTCQRGSLTDGAVKLPWLSLGCVFRDTNRMRPGQLAEVQLHFSERFTDRQAHRPHLVPSRG